MRQSIGDPGGGRRPAASRGLAWRALWLGVCLAAGLGIGALGMLLAGDTAWFLAVPACIAVGWFWLADPQCCLPDRQARGDKQARAMSRDDGR